VCVSSRASAGDGQAIVFREITRPGTPGTKGIGQAASDILGDIFIEGTGSAPCDQDPLDGRGVEGAVEGRMGQSGIEVTGFVPLA
jgi:hypothetical protein